MSIFFFVLSLFLRHLLFSELFRPLRSYQSLANSSLLSTHLFSLSILFIHSYTLCPFLHLSSSFSFLLCFAFSLCSLIFFLFLCSIFFHEIPSVFLDAYNFPLLSLFLRSEVGVDLISPHLCVRYLAPCLPTIVADSLRVTTSVSFMQLPMGRERV